MAVQLGAAVAVLAQTVPQPPPGEGPEWGKASPVGLVVVILLIIATVLLIKSMTGRIRRLPKSFERSGAGSRSGRGGGSDGGADYADPDLGDRGGSDSSGGGWGSGGDSGGGSDGGGGGGGD